MAVEGWPGHVLVEPGQEMDEGRWRISIDGLAQSHATVLLGRPGAEPIALKVSLPHRAYIAAWRGALLPQTRRLGLAELSEFVARASGRCELVARLRDRNHHPVAQAALGWWFDDELALGSIRDDLAALLRPLGELDAAVELQFSSSPATWSVCEFVVELRKTEAGLRPTHAVPEDSRVVARPLHAPATERDITPSGWAGGLQEFRPTGDLPGCSLIYVRRGERVLSRPLLLTEPPCGVSPSGRLAEVMAVADTEARRRWLSVLYEEAESDNPSGLSVVEDIARLAAGLDGLPPATFGPCYQRNGFGQNGGLPCSAAGRFGAHGRGQGIVLALALRTRKHQLASLERKLIAELGMQDSRERADRRDTGD